MLDFTMCKEVIFWNAIWKKKCPWDQGLQGIRGRGRRRSSVSAKAETSTEMHRMSRKWVAWQSLQQELYRRRAFKVREKGSSSTFTTVISFENLFIPQCPAWMSLPFFPLLPGCCMKNHIALLFTTGNAWKQPKWPLTDKWVKMWYTHTHTHTHRDAIQSSKIMK